MTTAGDTFIARQGICRDYAHLLISLARAAGVPARIASVAMQIAMAVMFAGLATIGAIWAWQPDSYGRTAALATLGRS